MTENASTVLREALSLPADERARVAADLIASLDEERADPQGVASAWASELERRARHALGNPESGEDWEAIRDGSPLGSTTGDRAGHPPCRGDRGA